LSDERLDLLPGVGSQRYSKNSIGGEGKIKVKEEEAVQYTSAGLFSEKAKKSPGRNQPKEGPLGTLISAFDR